MVGTEVFVSFDIGAAPDELEAVRIAFADADIPAVVSDQPYSLVASGGPDLTDAFVIVATTTTSGFLGIRSQGWLGRP